MDIFLVRHGEAAASWGQESDPGLSELGQQQAEQAARNLLGQLPGDIQLISSPLARAQETAAPLARELGAQVQINEAYREIPSPVPLEQRQEWLRTFMAQLWSQQDKELHQWRGEMLEAILGLEGPAVIFTHFLVINTLVGSAQGRLETLSFMPGNGSITQLCRSGTNLHLVALGDQMETVVN